VDGEVADAAALAAALTAGRVRAVSIGPPEVGGARGRASA
jgi:hypothetical protein